MSKIDHLLDELQLLRAWLDPIPKRPQDAERCHTSILRTRILIPRMLDTIRALKSSLEYCQVGCQKMSRQCGMPEPKVLLRDIEATLLRCEEFASG